MTMAMSWCENCGTTTPSISLGTPIQVIPVLKPGVQAEEPGLHSAGGAAEWVVLYRCRSKSGPILEIEASAATFCAAYTEARDSVCEFISDPFFGGACSCCYQVVKRPCCCCCHRRSRCR
jgi:hypothetical protein